MGLSYLPPPSQDQEQVRGQQFSPSQIQRHQTICLRGLAVCLIPQQMMSTPVLIQPGLQESNPGTQTVKTR